MIASITHRAVVTVDDPSAPAVRVTVPWRRHDSDPAAKAVFVVDSVFKRDYSVVQGGLLLIAGVIMIGSVLLGWHYAVDGYLGALIAWGAWRVGLWLAGRNSRETIDT